MSLYGKIETLYQRDDVTHRLVEPLVIKNRIYECLNPWVWTEKVDGTNIRVIWKDGLVSVGGRTDNAQLPAQLLDAIRGMATPELFASSFPDCSDVILYGEGYGAGIQKAGVGYSHKKGFILFDVKVGEWWLEDDDVRDVGAKMGIPVVPLFGEMTLANATEMVRGGILSRCASVVGTKAEGLVGRPVKQLFDRHGNRLIVKLKSKDFSL